MQLKTSSQSSISIFDLSGKNVLSENGNGSAGINSISLDKKITSGIYLVNFIVNNKSETKKFYLR